MKVYGHLRDQLSVAMVQEVRFAKAQPKSMIQLPERKTGSGEACEPLPVDVRLIIRKLGTTCER
jgi:hypothetical protein